MREITTIRRENAKLLAEQAGSPAAFARKLGLEDARVSHIIGKSPSRGIGNIMASRIEDAFGKPRGWLDQKHDADASPHARIEDVVTPYLATTNTFQLSWTSDDERDLLNEYRLMDEKHQQLLLNFAKKLEKDQSKLLGIPQVAK